MDRSGWHDSEHAILASGAQQRWLWGCGSAQALALGVPLVGGQIVGVLCIKDVLGWCALAP